MSHALVWLRRDLRLHDHTALSQAVADNEKVSLVFVFDKNIINKLPKDDKRVYFLYQSLAQINKEQPIHILYGDPTDEIPRLAKELKVNSIYVNRDYEFYAQKRDKKIKEALPSIQFLDFKDHVIFEGREIRTGSGGAYKVYTPFKNKYLQTLEESHEYILERKVKKFSALKPRVSFPSLDELNIEKPQKPYPFESTQKLKKDWRKKISNYDSSRDIPSVEGTSRFSPYLRFGLMSPREIIRFYDEDSQGRDVFISEIIWRDFYSAILQEFPRVEKASFKEKYRDVKWPGDKNLFKAWCEGKTGFPIVDAGMRQLNQTGWMHNRVRMITAAFLTKLCLVDWKKGEEYFALKLMDFDLASNNGGWQWSASTGTDAVPYFRIFNPETQSKKFDPEGSYIKQYVPELKDVPKKYIHNPSSMGLLGIDYPAPIIDYKKARDKALMFYKEIENAQ
jgi:deoxyribodipyrimidine photo-lyase